jgi:hypothetical protein
MTAAWREESCDGSCRAMGGQARTQWARWMTCTVLSYRGVVAHLYAFKRKEDEGAFFLGQRKSWCRYDMAGDNYD